MCYLIQKREKEIEKKTQVRFFIFYFINIIFASYTRQKGYVESHRSLQRVKAHALVLVRDIELFYYVANLFLIRWNRV